MRIFVKKKKVIAECDGGGVAVGDMATTMNTGGMGNAVPASMAGMTAADQCNPATFGSGDSWGNATKMNTQANSPKAKKKIKVKRKK